jgi:hypothetical protein
MIWPHTMARLNSSKARVGGAVARLQRLAMELILHILSTREYLRNPTYRINHGEHTASCLGLPWLMAWRGRLLMSLRSIVLITAVYTIWRDLTDGTFGRRR